MQRNEQPDFAGEHRRRADGGHTRALDGGDRVRSDGDGWPEILSMAYGRMWNEQWSNQGDGTLSMSVARPGYAGDDPAPRLVLFGRSGTARSTSRRRLFLTTVQMRTDRRQLEPGWSDQPANLNGNTFATACATATTGISTLNGEITHQWGPVVGSAVERPRLSTRPDRPSLAPPARPPWNWDFGEGHLADLAN
jgi:hypothetical protein